MRAEVGKRGLGAEALGVQLLDPLLRGDDNGVGGVVVLFESQGLAVDRAVEFLEFVGEAVFAYGRRPRVGVPLLRGECGVGPLQHSLYKLLSPAAVESLHVE